MLKLKYFAFVAIVLLLTLSACSSNKQVVVETAPEPELKPIELARDAASQGSELYQEKNYTEAIAAFTKAFELFNEAATTATESDSIALNLESMKLNIAKSYIDLAFEKIGETLYDDALDNFDMALDIYNLHTPVKLTQEELNESILSLYNNMAITAKNGKLFEEAIGFYDEILDVNPDNAEALNAKFNILSNDLQDDERAFKVLADYAAVSNDASAYIMLAERYIEKKNVVAAETAYLKALALRDNADMYSRLANFYRNNSEWAKANTFLEKLAATKPDNATLAVVYSQIGQNYAQLKNNAKMAEYLEKSYGVEANANIALSLASHYNGIKNWGKVVTFATAALNSDANNTAARMLRGVAYYQQKNYKSARPDLERLKGDSRYGAQVENLLKNMPK